MSQRLQHSLQRRRVLTLFVSLLVSLASGTNYVFSAYAPQLAARLHISHTRLNVIGLAGNVGVYLSSPFWGMIVDKTGPKPNMFAGFCLLLMGYLGIRVIYDTGLTQDSNKESESVSTATFLLLVLFSIMTGVGGNGGYSASLNVVAKSFPDSLRGSTVGIVVSGFGLSAFIFSFIAHHAFPGETSFLLLTLALGTALPMLIGFLFVRPIPLEEPPEVFPSEPDSQTPLLAESGLRRVSAFHRPLLKHLHGRKLLTSLDFWILFSVFSLVSGTGLMYINNVGSMAQILYLHENYPEYNEIEVSRWQATQVSTISLVGFVGRIFIGILSDFSKAHFALPRSYLFILVTATALASQIVASQVDVVSHLWRSSGLLGFGYGMLFSLSTSIVSEWFGLAHFSETVGFLTISPLIGGNIFSLAFGKNLDAHSPVTPQMLFLVEKEKSRRQCREGRVCYVDALYLTIVGCALSVLLSIWAGWRDHKRIERAFAEDEEREVERPSRVDC
ncbi:MFS general substrate transporter [Gymnopus androsaceus JB14]|uniref:MFS general substrate transporter n=1 Tax=Gymnopus androsaceus JB14 TaxID=1447944 RepID=A0A6A4I7J9_9AGAR|nr:MFS general substrate transporter [Gymnopus androsaceus JB14]